MNPLESYDYVVRQKSEGGYLWRKILLIVLYVTYVIGFFAFGVGLRILAPMIAVIPLTLWILVYFTWRYANVEHECVFQSGEMICSEIFGGKSRKTLFKAHIKDMLLIAPENEANLEEAEKYNPEKVYRMTSSSKSDKAYIAVFKNENDKNCVVYFEYDDKVLSILKYYNRMMRIK